MFPPKNLTRRTMIKKQAKKTFCNNHLSILLLQLFIQTFKSLYDISASTPSEFTSWNHATSLYYSDTSTVHRLYFATAVFALFLCQILMKFETQWQFWNLLVLRIPKHPLHAQFDEVLAEIFEVKDN